jgi:hypothetical protein
LSSRATEKENGWKLLLRPPRWVLLIILILASIDPVMHEVNARFPPEATVATPSHTLDTIIYHTAMVHAFPPYNSPYALWNDPGGGQGLANYALTFHHLYAAIGWLGGQFGVAPLTSLGIANGLSVMLYLYFVWVFLCLAVPRLANVSFLLFAAGGGLGGLAYLAALATGFTEHPEFASYFQRYFYYELCEGPRAQPFLMVTRLYYTLGLAFGFAGLAAFIYHASGRPGRYLYAGAMLLVAASLINFRVGPMLLGVAILYTLDLRGVPCGRKVYQGAVLCVGTATGCAAALALMRLNPEMVSGVTDSMRSALWLSPYASATFWYWLLLPPVLITSLRSSTPFLRIVLALVLGYIAAFLMLYGLYQAYYGNFWRTSEYSAAVQISDWALLATAPIGVFFLWRFKSSDPLPSALSAPSWVACWWCGLFGLAVSAFGQGYWLRFAPDRFVVIMGVPLAILGASAICRLNLRAPRLSRMVCAVFLVSGVLSCAVTWLVTYGPWGYETLQRSYPWTRGAFVSVHDDRLLNGLGTGRVLAPSEGAPLMGDLAVLRGNSTVFGVGTFNYTRSVGSGLRARVAEFFAPDTPESLREEYVRDWRAQFVLCPHDDSVAPETRTQLQQYPWLETIVVEGDGLLLRVVEAE